jgi:hypothetical protein
MHSWTRHPLLTVPAFLCCMLVCSGFDDATDLGAGVIEEIYPGLVTIDNHLFRFMDSSLCDSSFSLPDQSDTGFGVHKIENEKIGYIVAGKHGEERAAGYVQLTCEPDTSSVRSFSPNDTLRKITIRFFRDITIDTNTLPCRIAVWSSAFRSHALNPAPASGDTVRDTMLFVKAPQDSNNTSWIPDSIELVPGPANDTAPLPLAHKIFKACTTSTKDSSAKTFGFIVTNLDSGLIRLYGTANLTVEFTHDSDTTRCRNYDSCIAYYLATDGNSPSLQIIPKLSYASKRTAVFRYNAAPLWAAIDTERAQIVSAVFQLAGPDAGDTADIRYLLLDSLFRNGADVDTLFTAASSIIVPGTARVLADVLSPLQNHSRSVPRPAALYLYLRYAEDVTQTWRQTVWSSTPLLTATIAVP